MLTGVLLATPAWHGSAVAAPQADQDDTRITQSPGFISARRDVLHRMHGIRHMDAGQYAAAAEQFRTAARYADKISQAAYAEMLWDGVGVAQDRALAYAWMDLAAERGTRALLIKRERFWLDLSEAERARALEIGQQVYAEYGDDVAKPRQERIMRLARRNATGSRVGAATGNLRVVPASELMGNDWAHSLQRASGIDGEDYYADKYWAPEQHWQRQEREIERALIPRVRIGEIEDAKRCPESGCP